MRMSQLRFFYAVLSTVFLLSVSSTATLHEATAQDVTAQEATPPAQVAGMKGMCKMMGGNSADSTATVDQSGGNSGTTPVGPDMI